MRIFKYKIGAYHGEFQVELPIARKILGIQIQDGCPVIWALVDPASKTESKTFRFVWTGEPVELLGPYVGTVQLGGLVWHLFEMP